MLPALPSSKFFAAREDYSNADQLLSLPGEDPAIQGKETETLPHDQAENGCKACGNVLVPRTGFAGQARE